MIDERLLEWRKGAALVASALGEVNPTDVCLVRLSRKVLDLRARLERAEAATAQLRVLQDAVRRWMTADDIAAGGEIGSGWGLYELEEARKALRAVMHGTDPAQGGESCS